MKSGIFLFFVITIFSGTIFAQSQYLPSASIIKNEIPDNTAPLGACSHLSGSGIQCDSPVTEDQCKNLDPETQPIFMLGARCSS
jgi:hypothetical protein